MVKKKINIPKDKAKELEGFEEILDLVGIDKAEVQKRDTRPVKTFAIYDFLERENNRLRKLDQFFGKKVSIMEDHQQFATLIDQQKENRNKLQRELRIHIQDEDSTFQKFLSSQFDKFFDV